MQNSNDFFIGVDLGQRRDPSAIAVVQRSVGKVVRDDWYSRATYSTGTGVTFDLCQLQRIPLLSSYIVVVERIVEVARKVRMFGECTVVVDATGVGAPVVDLLKNARLDCELIPVTITAGNGASRVKGTWTAPKRDLITNLQLGFEQRWLRIAADLPERSRFMKELMEMKTRISGSGSDTYGAWKEGSHDDMVIAVALACWWGRRDCVGEKGLRLI